MIPENIATNSNEVKAKVKSPAIGLVCLGIISALVSLWGLSTILLLKDKSSAIGEQMMGLFIMLGIAGMVMTGLIIYGGFQMMSLKSLVWSKTAAILSICSVISTGLLGLLLGVPLGIWALIVLNKPEVKSAFKNTSQ